MTGYPDRREDGRVEDPQALDALADALRQERARREAAEKALQQLAQGIARAQGEAAYLRKAVRIAEASAREALEREEAAVRIAFQQAERRAQRVAVLETEVAALREAATRTAGGQLRQVWAAIRRDRT